jgi:ParB family chromosome partitioning protein
MSAKPVELQNGTQLLIPLSKLKKSSNNARKTPHSDAAIEAYARASLPKVSCKTWRSR